MNRILLVEDDRSIIRTLTAFFSEEGFQVAHEEGERQAKQIIGSADFDLCLLDLTLSDGDGFTVYESAAKKGLPVIFLTASGDENNVVRGLDMGAEDYIQKPFRPRELLARIQRVLRKNTPGAATEIVLPCGVRVNTERGTVTKNGTPVALTALEYRLLQVFLLNRGRILTREQLLWDIWDVGENYVNDNTLTVYIKRIREKIEDHPQEPVLIQTVRGMGYRME